MEEILWQTERKDFARARQPSRREKETERQRERKTKSENDFVGTNYFDTS